METAGTFDFVHQQQIWLFWINETLTDMSVFLFYKLFVFVIGFYARTFVI